MIRYLICALRLSSGKMNDDLDHDMFGQGWCEANSQPPIKGLLGPRDPQRSGLKYETIIYGPVAAHAAQRADGSIQ